MKILNKLVRDKIPEIIKAKGEIPKVRILNNDEFKLELLKKIVEESNEVLEANGKEELIKEIGDLLEVVDATIKAFNVNLEEISILRNKRKEERGGFDKQIFLESVE